MKLCYVDDDGMDERLMRCYFTDQTLEKQWGDDWNDAPYEYNAGRPYGPYRADEKWSITEYRIVSDADTPRCGHFNSPWTVEQINAGAVPWLVKDGEGLYAGASPAQLGAWLAKTGGVAVDPLPEGGQ